MDLNEYQDRAGVSNALRYEDESRALNAALFGLGSETGSLLDIRKKVLTDNLGDDVGDDRFRQELGDLLWYVARVANAHGMTLEEVARANLERVDDMWADPGRPWEELIAGLPVFDLEKPATEQFPRRIVFEFWQQELSEGSAGQLVAGMRIIEAEPYAFPEGPIPRGPEGEKVQGFPLEELVGDELKDNSRRVDGYRFHDAIHISFMATLNWSASMRSLLNLKRKSDDEDDEFEDSARPIFLEEGLVAVLAALARGRLNFRAESNVDGDTLHACKSCTEHLEVRELPGWLWRRAIVEGFTVMHSLIEQGGGCVIADLDRRQVSFSASRP